MRKFIIGALLSVLALGGLGVAAAAGPAQAGVESVAQYQARQQNPAAAPAAFALAVVCPSGDGSASWGDGKVCPNESGNGSYRVHMRDTLTDGHCVRAYAWSVDASPDAWLPVGTQACTTGQWITWSTGAAMCNPNARLYRGNTGTYFTMPTTAC